MTIIAPFAEDLVPGVPLAPAPEVTLDTGMAAQYFAITGDAMPLALSDTLSAAVTGATSRLANPALVISVAIGQSTVATRLVIANLQYRNLVLKRPVHIGETLRTIVTPRSAVWTRSGRDRAKVLLGMELTTADGESIASFERLALMPVAEADRLIVGDETVDLEPWALSHYRSTIPGSWVSPQGSSPLSSGDTLADPLADTVSSARELVRLTLNRAAAHRDLRAGLAGQRLVYGGHTVGLAQASLSRVLPDLLTVVAWRSCDHLGPVFEDDLLTFSTAIEAVEHHDGLRLVDATVTVHAHRNGGEPVAVLAWRPVLVLAGGTR